MSLSLSLGLLLGSTTGGGGGPTPAEPLQFFGTGLRYPTGAYTRAGNNYLAGDFAVGMPDHETSEIYFFFPTFYCSNTAEVDCPNGYTIEGIGTRVSGGLRTPGTIDDGTAPVVIDPAIPTTAFGKWVKFVPAAPITGGGIQVFSIAQFIPDGAYPRSRPHTAPNTSVFGGMTQDERSQGSASSLLSTLSGSSNYTNTNGNIVAPAMALCRTPAGVESVLILGTSIDYGANMNSNAAMWTPRHAFGYMELGLDEAVLSRRIQAANCALPGWGHESTGATNSQSDATACSRQLWAMAKAREINGGRPLCTAIVSGHGTNTSGDQTQLRADYRLLAAVWRAAVGAPETPIYQAEMLSYPQTTDGFATLANQTLSAGNTYPTGVRWLINADIGGADGLGDAAANLRADGTIQGSFAPWRVSAADLTSNRHRLSVLPFNTTLAADYAGSGTLSLGAAPTLGAYLSLVGGGNTSDLVVIGVSGTGPYTVTAVFTSGTGIAYTTGAVLREMWHDVGGLHPGPLAHLAYAEDSLVPLKLALGWDVPLAAPVITASSISGLPEDGQVLTANFTVTGNPAPTLTYQWQKNGTNISGQIASTITLNAGTMGLVDTDIISCEITATNSEGSAVAEPTAVFDVPAPPMSLYDTADAALISGTPFGDEIIDADSIRLARDASSGTLLYGITDAGANGNKRIRFTLSAYDGGMSGITLMRIEFLDGLSLIAGADFQTAGAKDFTHNFVNGSIRWRAGTTGRGGRMDGLIIEAA